MLFMQAQALHVANSTNIALTYWVLSATVASATCAFFAPSASL
jgi:hypothetical protein